MKRPRSRLVIGLVLMVAWIGSNLLWSAYVERERTMYAWDHVAYWSLTDSLAKGLKADPRAALAGVGRSLAEDELNLLPSLPLAPALGAFERSRKAWILTVLNLYALPALLLGWWALRRWGERTENQWDQTMIGWTWGATILLFAPLWEPLALGYLDIGGLVLIFAAAGLLAGLSSDGAREAVLAAAAIGVLVAVVMIFRRWYAFWSVSFCIVVALGAIGILIRTRRLAALRIPFAIGGSVLGTLLLLAGPRLATMAQSDYAGRFVHYKVLHSVGAELWGVVLHFGFVSLALAAAGAVVLICSRATRWPAIGIALQLLIIAVLFRRVQDPTPQHWYLILPGLMMLTAGGMTSMLNRLGSGGRKALILTISVLGIVTTAQVFGAISAVEVPALSSVRIIPKVRGDLPEFKRLMTWLDGRISMGARWIYVLAGTGSVSDSSLAFSNFSLATHFNSSPHVLMTAQVDLRDGFPDGLLLADIVVLPLPVAARGETQRVVSVPAQAFIEGVDIARAFVKLDEVFNFDGGVTAQVFERIRPNTSDEVQSLCDRLQRYYPEHPEIWTPPEG